MNIRENLKNNIEALKKLAFNETVEEVAEPTEAATETTETTETEQAFIDAQLSDGTIVNIEPDIELGASVAVATEEGIVPAEDAEHELASGERIVTVGGIITEIIATEEEVDEEEVVEEIEEEEMKDDVVAPNPKTVIERTEVERKFAELEDKLTEALKSNDEFKAQVIATLEDLNKEPSAAPTVKRKLDAFKRNELTFEDKLSKIKKLKKSK